MELIKKKNYFYSIFDSIEKVNCKEMSLLKSINLLFSEAFLCGQQKLNSNNYFSL
jgi:hypothetical protein